MLRKIQFGQKVKAPQIEKFKGVKDTDALVSVVSREGILCCAIHYEPGIGYFHCFEGACCADCGPARIYYLIPILVYHVTDWQSLTVDLEKRIDLRVLKISEESYNKLITNDGMINIETCDLRVITEDEKYQRLDFKIVLDRETRMARPPSWRSNDRVHRAVMSEYRTRYVSLIESSMGKTYNPETYAAAKARAAQNKPTTPAVSPNSTSIPPVPDFPVIPMDEPVGQIAYQNSSVPVPANVMQNAAVAGGSGMPLEAPPASSYTAVPPVGNVTDEDMAKLLG